MDVGDEELKTPAQRWLLTEPRPLDNLLLPIKLSKSIQFTAIDISTGYIWCGSSRANLYIFDRFTLKHVYLISTLPATVAHSSSITQVASYKSEQLCASTVGGVVHVSRIQTGSSLQPECVEAVSFSSSITQLVWHTDSAKLYIGDNTGSVYICSILTSKVIPRTSLLCRLDSCIGQLDFRDGVLLVSTLTRCTTYHTELKTYCEIGKKPRNGYYGAVLFPGSESAGKFEEPICYCARPGLRLWRADLTGKVLATLNFRQSLAESTDSGIVTRRASCADETPACPEEWMTDNPTTSFSYLRRIRDGLVLAVTNRRFLVLDPVSSALVISTQIPQDIVSCSISDRAIYFLTGAGDIRCIELTTLTEYIESLLEAETICEAIELCLDNPSYVEKEAMLIGRILEIVSPQHRLYQTFVDTFGAVVEEYTKSLDRRSSRSSTVSSVSGSLSERLAADAYHDALSIASGISDMTDSNASFETASSMSGGVVLDSGTNGNGTSGVISDIPTSRSSRENSPANLSHSTRTSGDVPLPCNSPTKEFTEEGSAHLKSGSVLPALINCSVRNQRGTGDDQAAAASSLDFCSSGPPDTTHTMTALTRRDSSRSITSVSSFSVELLQRRNSLTSMSSLDQPEGYPEDSPRRKSKHKARRVKPSTITFPSPERKERDSDDDVSVFHQTSPSMAIRRPTSSSLSSGDNPFASSSSSRSLAIEFSVSPKPIALSKEFSPGAVVDQVKDHVKEGISKISLQAKNIISSIKEKAASQPALEKLLATHEDVSPAGTPGELSEDNGSRHTFFIGDDDISMTDDMPSSLSLYLDLTEVTFSQLTDPYQLFTAEQHINTLLNKWAEMLCLLLKQYTRPPCVGHRPAERLLRYINAICPWRMSAELLEKSRYLATLCIIKWCCSALCGYTIAQHEFSENLHIPGHCLDTHPSSGSLHITDNHTGDSAEDPNPAGDSLANTHVPADDVTQFMSTFWFLMDSSKLCLHIQLLTEETSSERQKVFWSSFINSLTESRAERLEWRKAFNGHSLVTTYEMTKQLTQRGDEAGLWLYTYILIRQKKFEDAVNVALSPNVKVPLFHILYCIMVTCKLDGLELADAHRVFAKYARSLVQNQDVSSRPAFLRKQFRDLHILSFWLDSLVAVWRLEGSPFNLCQCGKPSEVRKEMFGASLHITTADTLRLLEDAFTDNEKVNETVLLIGGSMALIRQAIRDNRREDLINLLLLSSDVADLKQYLGAVRPTREDCLYLLQQRSLQTQCDREEVRCLWCESVVSRPHPPVSWDSIAGLILEWQGPDLCLDILAEASLPPHSVSTRFFSHCLTVHKENLSSSRVVADVIDGLEKFLWSNELSSKAVDPSLHHLMKKETELFKSGPGDRSISDDQRDELRKIGARLRQSASLRSIEDCEVHWGVTFSLDDECYYCDLPLLSHSSLPLTVFQCGHTNHQSCVSSTSLCRRCPAPNT